MRTTAIAAHRESCAGDWLIAVREHGLPARLPPALYCRDGISIDSLRWDPKKITQQAFVKLTLVKLLSPERRTVVAVSHPDRQQNLVEKNDENNRTKEPRGGFRLSYRP
jgi:hypothetical protein